MECVGAVGEEGREGELGGEVDEMVAGWEGEFVVAAGEMGRVCWGGGGEVRCVAGGWEERGES